MIARDGMAHLIQMVEIIILEKLQKLQDSVKDQVCNNMHDSVLIYYDLHPKGILACARACADTCCRSRHSLLRSSKANARFDCYCQIMLYV